jgi:hypothetical protein
LKETDRDIRERIEALKLALREGAHERGPRPQCEGGSHPSPLAIEELESAREIESDIGRCLVLERDVGDLIATADLGRAVLRLAGNEGGRAGGGAAPPRYIFLDLETTGFASTPLFLAGTMFERDGRLSCAQLLARDYSEERALIETLDRLMGGFEVCITFNGKSFDIPYLKERAKYHRLVLDSAPRHMDILHHARRTWRGSLPNCRLTTLEWHILGRRRGGDVSGWEVPCIYHEFVHTNDARRLVGVIRHNLLDVVSMAELLICLAEA